MVVRDELGIVSSGLVSRSLANCNASLSFVGHGIMVSGDTRHAKTKTKDNPRDDASAAVLLAAGRWSTPPSAAYAKTGPICMSR